MKRTNSYVMVWQQWKTPIALFCILAIAGDLRFANFPLKYGMDFDPTRDALVVAHAAANFSFPLIGPKSGIGSFTFGPWYYYELILFKLIFPNPFSPWIFIGIQSVLFVAVMYLIGKALEREGFGLLLALLAAFSPEQIGPTAGLSNPNLVPLHAALMVLFFIYYVKQHKDMWYLLFLWGLVFGIGVNHHYQVLLLAPLPIFAFLYKRTKKTFLNGLLFSIGTAVSFIPLLIYNIQNHWKTVIGFFAFISEGNHGTYIPNRWLFYVRDFWIHFLSMFSGVPIPFTISLVVITIGVLSFVASKKRLSVVYLLLLATFMIDFVFLRYFVVQKELYYFLFLHPFLFLFFGFALWQIKKIKFGWVFVTLILLAMLPFVWQQDTDRAQSNEYFVKFYNKTKAIERAFPGKRIAIYGCTKSDMNYPQAMAFFLLNDNRLADNGVPVELPTLFCKKDDFVDHGISYTDIPQTDAVAVDPPAIPAIKQISWKLVSPEVVYQETFSQ